MGSLDIGTAAEFIIHGVTSVAHTARADPSFLSSVGLYEREYFNYYLDLTIVREHGHC